MVLQTPIRGLRSFCIAAKCLSFKHAAEKLYLTPSAVSHQIKQLEEYLEFELFVRKTRSIELTRQGEQFYQALEPQLMGLAQTIESFKGKQHNKAILIGMPEFFASEIFIPNLAQWTQVNPDIDIQVDTSKTGHSESKTLDLSIVLTNGKPLGEVVEALFPIRYVPSCNPDVYKRFVKSGVNALHKVPLILHKSRPWAWHQWAQKMGIEDFNPGQIIQLDSMFAVARAAQQGMGVALVPLPLGKAWFEEKLLVKLFKQELHTKDRYYLVQHQIGVQDNDITEFAQWIKRTLADLK